MSAKVRKAAPSGSQVTSIVVEKKLNNVCRYEFLPVDVLADG